MSDQVLQRIREATRQGCVSSVLVHLSALLVDLASACESRTARLPSTREERDGLLTIGEAARQLGTSRDWLYRHAVELPFTVRLGRHLRFSTLGLARWIAEQADPTKQSR